MRTAAIFYLIAQLGSAQQIRLRPPLPEPAQKLPPVIHMCIAHCFALVLEDGHYNGPTDNGNTRIYTVESFTADSVILHRTDRGQFPLTADLKGKISGGNTIVDGQLTWTSGFSGGATFKAAWGAALNTVPDKDPVAQPSGQLPNQAAAVNLMKGIFSPQLKTAQEITYKLGTLETEMYAAASDCNSHRSTHYTDPGGYCAKRDRLKDERDDLIAAVVQDMRNLEDEEPKVAAECKSGKKEACERLEKVRSFLARDRAVRY